MKESCMLKIVYFLIFGTMVLFVCPAQAQYSQIYQDCLHQARSAIHKKDYREALIYLKAAQAIQPEGPEIVMYLNVVKRALEERVQELRQGSRHKTSVETPEDLPVTDAVSDDVSVPEEGLPSKGVYDEERDPAGSVTDQGFQSAPPKAEDADKQGTALFNQTYTYKNINDRNKSSLIESKKTPLPRKDSVVSVISTAEDGEEGRRRNIIELDSGAWSLQPNTKLEIPMDQEIVFRSPDGIDRFLVISPDVLKVTRLGSKEIRAVPDRYGRTFIHIWDSAKRWTFYIRTVFESELRERDQAKNMSRARYVDSFRLTHDLDWSSYSRGPSFSDLKRQSLNFRNQFSLFGPTPYGDFDSYLVSYKTDVDPTEITDYSMGLTGAQWKSFKNIELRIFDADRYISDLTLPGRNFRGVLLTGETLNDQFAFTVLRGEDQAFFGALSPGTSSSRESYLEALQLVYRLDAEKQVTANYARAWGDNRSSSASGRVLSAEYEQMFDQWSLFSEFAYDEREYAQHVGVRYSDEERSFFAKFRNVPSDYATIVGPTGNQGEVGLELSYTHKWGETDLKYFLDVYRDRENKNPEDEQAINLDFNAGYRRQLTDMDFLQGNLYFIRTPGLLSDRQDFRLANTYAHRFQFFHIPNAQISLTNTYQRSRSDSSPSSDYDRSGLGVNFSLPINRDWNYTAGYDAFYVNDVAINEKAYPSVFTTGLSYNKTFSDRWRANAAAYYRDEQKAEDAKSFLAGQDSLTLSTNLTFTPKTGFQIYLDGRVRDVWAENNRSDPFMEGDVRLGVRSEWDLGCRWNPTGIIEGWVFKDVNANGARDEGDPGIPGVRVNVGEEEVITDAEGWYFVRVHAASVVVDLDVNTIPEGYVFQGSAALTFDITHNHYYSGNFALTTESGIYGVVYYDENANGRPDNGDQFLNKIQMTLDGKTSAVTDAKGAYFFYNISEGKHTLVLDINSLPMEYLPTIPLKNDIEVSEGTTYIFHVPVNKRIQPK